ncbi:sensor histidine kinase [Arthrobacter sp. CG_A4]|uniref:sensor histidine kinase n=1 Tax=Arthrobacter sp. CG_A4 TaxID=3071706 RepID=UPI002E150A06
MTAAIASAGWKPYVSLGFTVALLAGQLVHVIPAMYSNDWAIYLGSFIALGFIQWTAGHRTRLVAAGANVAFAAVMTLMMLSWRYSNGLGGCGATYAGDRYTLVKYGWQLFALLAFIAASCAAVGLLLALYQERGSLFRARSLAQSSLKETEVDLIIEQERTRIARDLHDVLAHSLAVIAAQADGTRYLSKDQPKAVLNALENIATSARSALVGAQRVIEGVRDDGLVTPQPRLSDVEPLVERMQDSLSIERSATGVPVELSAGQQLAVFRIVQECLTNADPACGVGGAVRRFRQPGKRRRTKGGPRPRRDAGTCAPCRRLGDGRTGRRTLPRDRLYPLRGGDFRRRGHRRRGHRVAAGFCRTIRRAPGRVPCGSRRPWLMPERESPWRLSMTSRCSGPGSGCWSKSRRIWRCPGKPPTANRQLRSPPNATPTLC